MNEWGENVTLIFGANPTLDLNLSKNQFYLA